VREHFVPTDPRTPAGDIRKMLDEAEIMVANLGSADPGAMEILHLIDGISEALEALEATGMDARPERSRFETVQRRLNRDKKSFVFKVGGLLQKERADIQPTRERWWWYLDEALAQERRKRLRRILIWGGVALILLVVLGVVYSTFFAPSPELRLSYRHRLAGEDLAVKGDLEGALVEFEAAIALIPDDPVYLIWVGVLRSELDEPGAESAFEDARLIYETPGEFFLARAQVYRTVGDYEAALADVNQAIADQPESGWNYYERALIYQDLGDRNAAIDDLDTADELAQEAEDHELEAFARYQRGLLLVSPPVASTPTP
jgi:tetratricopeptide (TPR) repeat protein